MDILQELPVEQWPLLQEKLKHLWPLNVPGYYTLHANLKYPELREAYKLKVYCPHGNMDNGFVAINKKSNLDVILFSNTEDTSKIEEAIIKTRLIDWSKPVYFDIVTSVMLSAMERVNAVMKFERFDVWPAKMYHLAGNTNLFTEFRLPDNTTLTSVKPEHIQRVDDTWPYKHPGSDVYFATLAANGLSYGLYSFDTKELLAWIFVNEFNFLCHFYVEEKHRRRGYGRYVMQCAVNDFLKDGHDTYAYVVEGNMNPLGIFAKFNFKVVDDSAFLCAEKPSNKT